MCIRDRYEYDKEEIDQRPYRCPQEGCEYRAKQKGRIKDHLANIHDIGHKKGVNIR